jgi:hypothetical protein
VGGGQPVLCEGVPAWPWQAVALTASAPRLTPVPHDGVPAYPEQTAVTRHGIVPIVPQQHAFQLGALRRDRPMQAPPQRVFDCLPLRAEPRRTRFAPDGQLPVPRFPA